MVSTELDRTYEVVVTAQEKADALNNFFNWFKNQDRKFYRVKELREKYFNREKDHYLNDSDKSQMTWWLRKLCDFGVIELDRGFETITVPRVGYHWEAKNGMPEKFKVWDEKGNEYIMENTEEGEYKFGEYEEEIKTEYLLYKYIGA